MAVATERLHLACSQYVDVAARGGRQFNRCTAAIASVVKPARTTIAALRLDQSARIEFYAAGRRIQRYGRIPTVEISAAALCIYPRAGTLDKNPAGSRCREFYRRRAPRGRAFAAITGVAAVGLDNSAGIELDAAVAAGQRNGGSTAALISISALGIKPAASVERNAPGRCKRDVRVTADKIVAAATGREYDCGLVNQYRTRSAGERNSGIAAAEGRAVAAIGKHSLRTFAAIATDGDSGCGRQRHVRDAAIATVGPYFCIVDRDAAGGRRYGDRRGTIRSIAGLDLRATVDEDVANSRSQYDVVTGVNGYPADCEIAARTERHVTLPEDGISNHNRAIRGGQGDAAAGRVVAQRFRRRAKVECQRRRARAGFSDVDIARRAGVVSRQCGCLYVELDAGLRIQVGIAVAGCAHRQRKRAARDMAAGANAELRQGRQVAGEIHVAGNELIADVQGKRIDQSDLGLRQMQAATDARGAQRNRAIAVRCEVDILTADGPLQVHVGRAQENRIAGVIGGAAGADRPAGAARQSATRGARELRQLAVHLDFYRPAGNRLHAAHQPGEYRARHAADLQVARVRRIEKDPAACVVVVRFEHRRIDADRFGDGADARVRAGRVFEFHEHRAAGGDERAAARAQNRAVGGQAIVNDTDVGGSQVFNDDVAAGAGVAAAGVHFQENIAGAGV